MPQEPAAERAFVPGAGARLLACGVVAAGLAWMGLVGWRLARYLDASGWVETRCTVDDLRVLVRDNAWTADVRYAYEFGGACYESTRLSLSEARCMDQHNLGLRIQHLTPGPWNTCWVDPGDPSQAVLERPKG
jgi:hypothetical protein